MIRIKPVLAPLPHIAVHVVQAPGVRLLLPHRMQRSAIVVLVPGVVAELRGVVAGDGANHFVGFLEEIGSKGVEGLLAVPGAAPRTPQPLDQADELRERAVRDLGRVG